MRNTILCGDALTMLKTMPSNYVQMVCTSPPYYGLRDYNTEIVYTLEGDPTCEHVWIHEGRNEDGAKVAQCQWCHAVKVDQQIGQEDTPQAYITRLVEVFREVRRVLREDGVLWLNLGDTYTSHSDTQVQPSGRAIAHTAMIKGKPMRAPVLEGMKPKNLMMIPARVAIALQEDGWYLRSEIVWEKPNAMPESVQDRCTRSHEMIYMLAKSERYYYDNEAIKEPIAKDSYRSHENKRSLIERYGIATLGKQLRDGIQSTNGYAVLALGRNGKTGYNLSGRNKRSVWTVALQPYSESHFATFPAKLIEPCILAGSRPGDIVLDCFMGAGTTALVALQHGRDYLGVELNPTYIALAEKRIATIQPHLWTVEGISA